MTDGRLSLATEAAGAQVVSRAAFRALGPGDDSPGHFTNTTTRSSRDT